MKGRVLVIQLTRTGDLVQTLQAVRQFKAETPGIECSLIARKSLGKGIQFLLETVFEKIYYIDTKELLTGGTFKSGLGELHKFLKDVSFSIDIPLHLHFNSKLYVLLFIIGS